MSPFVQDIKSLLAASRDLLSAEVLDSDRLRVWAAERKAIFSHLKDYNPEHASSDSSAMEPLLQELLDLDAKICARVIESQRRLGIQIAGARRIRQALRQGTCPAPQLLERLA